MNRNKNFASSIMNNVNYVATVLSVFFATFWLLMIVMPAMESGDMADIPVTMILGLAGGLVSIILGLVTFILETVMAVKARKNSEAYAQKGRGLAITTLVFQILTFVATVLVAVGGSSFISLLTSGTSNPEVVMEALITYGPAFYPCFAAAAVYAVSIAFKIAGIVGCKKKAEAPAVETPVVEAPVETPVNE